MDRAQYTPEARRDLKEIALWIGRRDRRPKVAAKIVREIKARCDDCANSFAAGSNIGTPRPELGTGYRVFPHKRWVIIFRQLPRGIEVVRIIDGARDFDRLFGD